MRTLNCVTGGCQSSANPVAGGCQSSAKRKTAVPNPLKKRSFGKLCTQLRSFGKLCLQLRSFGKLRLQLLTLLLLVFCFALSAQPLALQSFENSANDTWAYTANPASTVPYFWGRTNQVLGGASAQSGSWYWASWLLEPNECSVSFANVAITPGTQHSVSFYYYSKNLDPATDVFQVCLEYDGGTQWNNWISLPPHTLDWALFSIDMPPDASTVRMKIETQYANPNMDKFAHWDNFSLDPDIAQYTVPIVYNTSIAQRTDGSKLVDISYDLFDANGDLCEIGLSLSDDGGNSFPITPLQLSGDVGEGISSGTGKYILWDAGAEDIEFDGSQYVLQFDADDGTSPVPENFVFVPGGTIYPAIGIYTGGLTVASFYIDK